MADNVTRSLITDPWRDPTRPPLPRQPEGTPSPEAMAQWRIDALSQIQKQREFEQAQREQARPGLDLVSGEGNRAWSIIKRLRDWGR